MAFASFWISVLLFAIVVGGSTGPWPHGRTNQMILSILAAISVAGTMGLILAQAARFNLATLSGGMLVLSLVVGWIARRHFSLQGLFRSQLDGQKPIAWSRLPGREWLPAILVIGAGAALFFPPHQFILGGADAGVYVNLAANLIRTKSWLIQDNLLATLDPGLWSGLLRAEPPSGFALYTRLPGFYVLEPGSGIVIPQFYPLHTLWLAIGYAGAGVWGSLAMTPLWATLSGGMIYLAVRDWFGRQTALLTTLLLLLTPLQLYFARYPTAEPITQFFVWSHLWTFSHYIRPGPQRRLWGVVAGLTFGQVFLARIDAPPLLLIPTIWAFFLFLNRRWSREEGWFFGPVILLLGIASIHGAFFSRPYVLDTYGHLFQLSGWLLLLAMALLSGGAALLWFVQRQPFPLVERLYTKATQKWARQEIWGRVVAASIVLLALYAYFIRPSQGLSQFFPYWYSGTIVPSLDHENLVRLGWYLSPLGISLAVLGGVRIALNGRWDRIWPWWVAGGIFTLIYVYRIFNNPFQIYAMRRYVPVVLPFLVIGIAYALRWLWGIQRWHPGPRLFALVAGAALMGWLGYNDRLIWDLVEYDGVVSQVEQIADYFDDQAIVLYDDPAPVGLGAILGTPLQFLHGIPSFELQEELVDLPRLRRQIAQWQMEGHPVYLVQSMASFQILAARDLEWVTGARLDFPLLEQSYEHPPSQILTQSYEMQIFQIKTISE